MTDHLKTIREALESLQGLCSEQSDFVEQITIWTPEALDALDALEQAMREPVGLRETLTRFLADKGVYLSKESIDDFMARAAPPAQQAQPTDARPPDIGRTCPFCDASWVEQAQAEAVPDWNALRHSANEWADMATNGLQWLRNIVDGISDPKEALSNMEDNLKHCQGVNDAPAVQRAVRAAEAAHKQAEAVPVWTTERITEVAQPIAIEIAENCRTAPQLVFPHLFLGLKKLLTEQAEAVPQDAAKAWQEGFRAGDSWRSSAQQFWEDNDYGNPPKEPVNPYIAAAPQPKEQSK